MSKALIAISVIVVLVVILIIGLWYMFSRNRKKKNEVNDIPDKSKLTSIRLRENRHSYEDEDEGDDEMDMEPLLSPSISIPDDYPTFSEQIHAPATFDRSVLELDDESSPHGIAINETTIAPTYDNESTSSRPSQQLILENSDAIF